MGGSASGLTEYEQMITGRIRIKSSLFQVTLKHGIGPWRVRFLLVAYEFSAEIFRNHFQVLDQASKGFAGFHDPGVYSQASRRN